MPGAGRGAYVFFSDSPDIPSRPHGTRIPAVVSVCPCARGSGWPEPDEVLAHRVVVVTFTTTPRRVKN